MPQSLAAASAILKEIYSGGLREQLNQDVTALKRVKRSSDGIVNEVGGKYVTFPIHTRRNTGIGARNENEALPVAGQQKAAGARIGLKYQYGAIELTGQALSLADTNVQAFISAVDFETEGLRNDLATDLNRQVYGTQIGTLATCTAQTSVNALVVTPDASLIELDAKVDIVLASDGTVLAAGRNVTGINGSTVTIDGAAVTTTTNHIIVRSGNYGREWNGFQAIFNSGTYENIDGAVEPVWTANTDSNGGTARAVSEALFNKMSDTIKQRGGSVTALFSTYGVQRAYANLLQQQRHYVNTDGVFGGGYKQLAYMTPDGDVPFVVDRMAPKGKVWFMNEKNIKLYQDADWDWMTYGGSDRWRLKSNASGDFDAYIARMFQYSELGIDKRNTHGQISDLLEG